MNGTWAVIRFHTLRDDAKGTVPECYVAVCGLESYGKGQDWIRKNGAPQTVYGIVRLEGHMYRLAEERDGRLHVVDLEGRVL